MKRLVGLFAIAGVAAAAFAMSSFEKTFYDTYKIAKTSNIAKLQCGLCHTSAKGGKLNPYGADLKAQMGTLKLKKLTTEALKAVENLDSDKDGMKNGDEIKKDRAPGAAG